LCAFVCSVRSFESSKMRLSKFFTYPLIELLETWQMNQHGSFSSCCPIGVCIILEGVVQVIKKFLLTLGGLWRATGLLFKRSLLVPHVCPILTTHGKIIQPFVFTNV
jgi:hypothetical protein